MATKAKVGLLALSGSGTQAPSLQEYAAFFRQAEDLGFDSLWVIDRVFHHIGIMDPLTLLTSAATLTSRIRLGTAVLLLAFRNPVLVAKSAATLDCLSGGRLTLGVSLGGRDKEWPALGVPVKQRVSRFRENLAIMRQLWAESNVTYHGRYYQLEDVQMYPKPVQRPGIPVIFGGQADPVLQRAAQDADGWVAGVSGSVEAFAQNWQKVRMYAQAAGRNPDSLESGKLMYIIVGPDRERCRERLVEETTGYTGAHYDVDNYCAFGPLEECAAKIQRFIDAGAKTIILGPPWPEVEQAKLIANQVVPRLN